MKIDLTDEKIFRYAITKAKPTGWYEIDAMILVVNKYTTYTAEGDTYETAEDNLIKKLRIDGLEITGQNASTTNGTGTTKTT